MGIAITPVHAQTASTTQGSSANLQALLNQIQSLLDQIHSLQDKLASLRGDVRTVLQDNIQQGMSGDDIKKIQELLATDRSIYPEGLVTGYFGPLTREALKRFQHRHGLDETGDVSSSTRALLEGYLQQGFGDNVPQGLLRAPGIMKKVEDRLCSSDNPRRDTGPLCKRMRDRITSSTSDSGSDDSLNNDDNASSTTSGDDSGDDSGGDDS